MLSISTVSNAFAAIPGMKGPDHIGFTVPNLEQAVTFFVDVLGCEPFFQLGPFKSDNNWMQEQLKVHPRAEIPAIQLMRCANGSNLEIFEYVAPDQDSTHPKNSDIGGHHIGFYVEDMDAAVAYLKEQGIKVLGEPTLMTVGAKAGCIFWHPGECSWNWSATPMVWPMRRIPSAGCLIRISSWLYRPGELLVRLSGAFCVLALIGANYL